MDCRIYGEYLPPAERNGRGNEGGIPGTRLLDGRVDTADGEVSTPAIGRAPQNNFLPLSHFFFLKFLRASG